jgi:phenylalanyl-tRNA synthetase beta chain
MLLDGNVRYEAIEKLAFQTDSRLLRQVNLFDVYEGDKIAAGKKSYAISFTLRDDESTLQDKQIDSVMDRLMKQFESKLGAVIRKA